MHIQKVHEDEEILKALKEYERNLATLNITNFTFTVFISAPYMMPNAKAFKTFFEQHKINVLLPLDEDGKKERLEESDLLKYIGQYHVALIGDDRYTANIIKLGALSNNKKLIGLMKWGTGIDSIDQDAANKYGVIIKNTTDAFSEPVAESILGSVLSFNRGLFSSTRMMQDLQSGYSGLKEREKETKAIWVKVPGKTLPESTFGIIGFGNVGKATAKKLLALGAKSILTYDILGEIDTSESKKLENSQNICRLSQSKSMNDVLDNNPDFLLVTCSQNKDNIKMIGRKELQRLNKGKTVLINMARGSLIDESELIKALQGLDGLSLKGAALDVYWDEPLPVESPLRVLPNVVLTSHNANSSPLYWLKVHLNTIKNTFELLSEKVIA